MVLGRCVNQPNGQVIIIGPFETKEKAVQNAAKVLTARQQRWDNKEPSEPVFLIEGARAAPLSAAGKHGSETLGLLDEGKG
jgi:hypothetical protein